MKLIGATSSPFVRKVRIVLAEKKLDVQFVLENVWAGDSMLAVNPLGKVPCLVMDGSDAVFDSRVICEYVDTLSPVGRLIPASGRERVAVRTWEALADGVLDACVSAYLERHWAGRTAEQRSEAWVARQFSRIHSALDAMERGLADDQPYCLGVHLTLADIATGCALSYIDLRHPDLAWREQRPKLQRLYDKLMARPSFITTAPPAP